MVVEIFRKQAGPVQRADNGILSGVGKHGHFRDPFIHDDLTGAVASRDCGEVDLGVVDAVEDVGEDGGRERQADLHQLGVAVAGGLDRGEVLVADGAAGLRELADEADQRIALGIAGGLARRGSA